MEHRGYLTVLNSMYATVPVAATKTSKIHMTKVILPLFNELRMILSAAKTLVYNMISVFLPRWGSHT